MPIDYHWDREITSDSRLNLFSIHYNDLLPFKLEYAEEVLWWNSREAPWPTGAEGQGWWAGRQWKPWAVEIGCSSVQKQCTFGMHTFSQQELDSIFKLVIRTSSAGSEGQQLESGGLSCLLASWFRIKGTVPSMCLSLYWLYRTLCRRMKKNRLSRRKKEPQAFQQEQGGEKCTYFPDKCWLWVWEMCVVLLVEAGNVRGARISSSLVFLTLQIGRCWSSKACVYFD